MIQFPKYANIYKISKPSHVKFDIIDFSFDPRWAKLVKAKEMLNGIIIDADSEEVIRENLKLAARYNDEIANILGLDSLVIEDEQNTTAKYY